ncbi:MAG TPA: Bax inhibitor-1/YccA family protein [Flavipsychrobacter sp.]|jgi:FtsH-binding integral membrane protein|nr:Bax inhibitor-1/YccA family protein [Flavipsychrobacter sp.]
MDNFGQNRHDIFGANVVENTGSHAISKNFVANVFLWMFLALGISAAVALYFSSNEELLIQYLVKPQGGLNMLGWVIMFAPLGFVMLMSFGFARLSAPAMTALFLLYAAINGISFSFILLAFTASSVVGCFLSAAAMFGVMAVMGYTTDKDLTSFGRILSMGVIGILIAMVINFFLHSNTMDYIISIIGVMVFTGLTAYDVQKLKRIGAGMEYEGTAAANVKKTSILGALTLYLDFINIFLFLLRLFGGRRN